MFLQMLGVEQLSGHHRLFLVLVGIEGGDALLGGAVLLVSQPGFLQTVQLPVQGSRREARSLIFRFSGVMDTPAARRVFISASRFSQSSATPLPRMFTTPSRKMPEGSRCRANLPFSLMTVCPALPPPDSAPPRHIVG